MAQSRICLFSCCGLLDGFLTHPVWLFSVVSHLDSYDSYRGQHDVSRSLLAG